VDYNLHLLKLSFQTKLDSRDQRNFTRSGLYQVVLYEYGRDQLSAKPGYSKLEYSVSNYVTFLKRNTLIARISFGAGDETLPETEWFFLGGENTFYGMAERQLVGRRYNIFSFGYQYRLPVSSVINIYIYFRYDLGTVTIEKVPNIGRTDYINGKGIGIGIPTFVGPLRISYGWSSLGKKRGYFYLGKYF
jgi:outer membrane protein assembly factor BamA